MKTRRGKCKRCERLAARVAVLERQLSEALAKIKELERKLALAQKDSSTSSKPPSSDITKPPRRDQNRGGSKTKRRGKPKPGGQSGHPRHTRPEFPPDQVDRAWIYEWDPADLGDQWEPLNQFQVVQQAELRKKPILVTEHRARCYRNRWTGKIIAAPLPPEVRRGGLLGPRLSAMVAYQKGACHMSYSAIREFLKDVMGFSVSEGQLAKVNGKVSEATAACYEELKLALPRRRMVNVDETSHPENGRKFWTWGFHVPGRDGFTLFHIDPSRSADVLSEFLGEEFGGVVGCDYHSAYRRFLRETDAALQFCWAHLIRDVKFLTTLSDKSARRYGERVLAAVKRLFRVWHRRDESPPARWERDILRARDAVLQAARRPPFQREAQNVAKRFREHGDYYFTFVRLPGVEPTNNAMERQFRQVVIDRKVTQGTRGERGRRWSERIWTVIATCRQQERSAFDFIHRSLLAYFRGAAAPSLLPAPS